MGGLLMKFDDVYQTYSNYPVREVPEEHLKHLIFLFVADAALNMGSNVEKANVDRVIEIIRDHYGFLPVYVICSAFVKGSMGYLGEGRLIPKNINNWLREIRVEYEREAEHKRIEERLNSNSPPVDLVRYPMGEALIKKIEWLTSGAIDGDDYDKIDLKVLAEMIGFGQQPTLEDFNIVNKNG